MPTAEFLQLIVVAAIAGYIGYLLGRASVKSAGERPSANIPLPGPEDTEVPAPARRSSPPPPAGAGSSAENVGSDRAPPRRSTAPPPAAAGLLKRDE